MNPQPSLGLANKPKDIQNGTLLPVPHDHPGVAEVLAFNIPADDTVAFSFPGSPFFSTAGATLYDLLLETVDPSELPHGHGVVRTWEEENPQVFDGKTPIPVTAHQRMHVSVSVRVPANAVPPGPFSGTLEIKGKTIDRTVALTGTYLGVAENTPIGQKWHALGGEAFFGEVKSNVHPAPDSNGSIQDFANGILWDTAHGVFYLSAGIAAKWNSLAVQGARTATGDLVRTTLGIPTEDTFATVDGGQALRFQGGAIVLSSGSWVVYGAIYALYRSFGDLADRNRQPLLGLPRSDETIAPDGVGRFNHFETGSIYWTAATGPHEVHGLIRDKWAAMGWERGPLGYPTTNEIALPDGKGRFNHFQTGSIYWTPDTGAHEVNGLIRDKWAALGWERGFLGYPLTDETVAPDGVGRYNHFQGGSIYWTPATGAHEVHGLIRDKWSALGWERGLLGYPVTDETGTPDGIGRYNHFQGGSIYWTPATGAHEVHGSIRNKWAALGWENGYLGYPVSDEGFWMSPAFIPGRVSSFQFGKIGWTSSGGALELPDEVSQNQGVLTPSGTALGGSVTMTVRSNGSYSAQFHMHDSGAPDYDFQVHAIWAASNGITFVSVHSGHVEGTVSTTLTHAPNRDNDFTDNGFHPFIRTNWPAVSAGRLWVTKDYSPTGVIGFIQDVAKIVVDVVAGAAGATLGVVIALGAEAGKLFGNLGLGGTFGIIAGVVVFATGGGIVLAVVAGVATGVVTNALIKQRPLSLQEAQFAAPVFGASLPPADQIILTNMAGLGGRAFTMPGVDGKIYVNLGDAYNNPLGYTSGAYRKPGQVLIHELTHAWQIAHSSFVPGMVCSGIVNQANYNFGQSVYQYGPPGPPWGDFNLEAQGAIVDQWFGGDATAVVPVRKASDTSDPYFGYIANNIRAGRS